MLPFRFSLSGCIVTNAEGFVMRFLGVEPITIQVACLPLGQCALSSFFNKQMTTADEKAQD